MNIKDIAGITHLDPGPCGHFTYWCGLAYINSSEIYLRIAPTSTPTLESITCLWCTRNVYHARVITYEY